MSSETSNKYMMYSLVFLRIFVWCSVIIFYLLLFLYRRKCRKKQHLRNIRQLISFQTNDLVNFSFLENVNWQDEQVYSLTRITRVETLIEFIMAFSYASENSINTIVYDEKSSGQSFKLALHVLRNSLNLTERSTIWFISIK